jgi:hypothetical protein
LLNPKGENLKVHENPVEGVHIADATQGKSRAVR